MRGYSVADGWRDAAGNLRDGGFVSDRIARCLDLAADCAERCDGRRVALAVFSALAVGVLFLLWSGKPARGELRSP